MRPMQRGQFKLEDDNVALIYNRKVSASTGHPSMPNVGDTSLSIRSEGGHVWLVDQNGLQVKGVKSVKAISSVDNVLTEIEIVAYSHDNGEM